MASDNKAATQKFIVILNEKSPVVKLLSATGQSLLETVEP